MARYNERLNRIMLALTLVTIVFTPPGIIGGLMGMNVLVPGQKEEDSYVPFYIVLGLIAFLMLLIIAAIKCFGISKGF